MASVKAAVLPQARGTVAVQNVELRGVGPAKPWREYDHRLGKALQFLCEGLTIWPV